MRPPRIAILVLFFSASLFLFCRSISSLRRSSVTTPPVAARKSSLRSIFSFTAPFTLFPPNAAISLTDDNSTFFPARPAAFGPALPTRGLSGQLWIGSGFADDNLQEGEGEGELGCSDVAGWEDGRAGLALAVAEKALAGDKSSGSGGKSKNPKRDDLSKGPVVDRKVAIASQKHERVSAVDDGTDDYLHEGLQQNQKSHHESSSGSGTSHADIQSIQETAEITGKVVLLSRGGCGFLEKVKWAQRRGAIALIVGDNQKGGPLIQMFARGNVDNVTIPSIFTSRTTAHLLSSLMQPGSFIEDILDENGKPVQKVQQSDKLRKKQKAKQQATTSAALPRATANAKRTKAPPAAKKDTGASSDAAASPKVRRGNWFSRLFHWGGSDNTVSDRSRPPSSGRLDWVLVDDWNDEKDKLIKNSLDKASKTGREGSGSAGSQRASGDGFQIGVQDWRDPDLVSTEKGSLDAKAAEKQSSSPGASAKQYAGGDHKDSNGPKGGSITPGSGEYSAELSNKEKSSGSGGTDGQPGLISKIFGDDDEAESTSKDTPPQKLDDSPSPIEPPSGEEDGDMPEHEGLWVTITPTSSASPFFDTLLVLVVSPLITLTVVYALLVLRARIRRRRWRAPKSVVEQLPVRTYHTVAPSPTHSPRLPSPTSSSPTTPLLQSASRSRPRSRTTTGVPETDNLLRVDAALQAPRSPSHEKHSSNNISSEWKKYMGRQVECVVCLEEYVDGVSRVMSLPCGHEFHVECITPWLTTRRRTCPICKGDVVRSLARGSPSSPRYEPYRDDSDDDLEPSGSGGNVSGSQDRDSDVEQGILSPAPRGRRPDRPSEGWFSILSNGLGAGSSTTGARLRRDESEEESNRRWD